MAVGSFSADHRIRAFYRRIRRSVLLSWAIAPLYLGLIGIGVLICLHVRRRGPILRPARSSFAVGTDLLRELNGDLAGVTGLLVIDPRPTTRSKT